MYAELDSSSFSRVLINILFFIQAILEVTALELLNPNRVRKLLQEVIYVNFATDIV